MSNTSTAIREIEHNPAKNELRVTFQSGATYAYDGVTRETANQFASAESKGAFFNSRLYNLPSRRV